MSRIERFLEALRTSPEAEEFLKNRPAGGSMEEETAAYAEIAGRLGYEISAEELRAYAEETAASRRGRTEQAANTIRSLSEDEMSEAAGGGDTCKSTYKNRENCWRSDGCDNIVNYYDHYVCSWYYYTKCEVAKHG